MVGALRGNALCVSKAMNASACRPSSTWSESDTDTLRYSSNGEFRCVADSQVEFTAALKFRLLLGKIVGAGGNL